MIWQLIFGFVGGLGLFLFGMQMMASGLQKVAGDKLRRILEILTSKPIIATLTGIVVTLLVQSSSTTTVMVVGFANAGLMNLNQAVGTILGANIGTTITAQIVSFKISALALPAIGVGAFINFFARRRLHKYLSQAILGFGLLFYGMSTMAEGMRPLQDIPQFHNLLVYFADYPLLGVLAGALFTALIQSSSAASGAIIALTLQDLITFHSAVPLILGLNVGTCVTAMLASIGTSLTARRAAAAHVLFNIFGVIIALIFLNPFMDIVVKTADTLPRQVANAHTIFNVLNTMIVLPLFSLFVELVRGLVPGEEVEIEIGPKYLDRRMLKTPAVALGSARKEILRMAKIAREMISESMDAFFKNDLKKLQHVLQMEELVDDLEKQITVYLAELSQHSLTKQQTQSIQGLMSAANDLERIGDHAEVILQRTQLKIEDKLPFSEMGLKELRDIYTKVEAMLDRAIESFDQEDKALAREVIEEDDVIDNLERKLRKNHINRINEGSCYPPSGVLYLDLLSSFERVADHATNIAELVIADYNF
ncbi:MAG: Na/Pi cotransporter family protein [Dethiobacteria bacterium]|jgi:phosphate:Na+ symporter